MLDITANSRAVIGANHPPGPIDSAKEAFGELAAWLKEHPAIQTRADAKEGGAYIERTRIALQDARAARDAETRPLNDRLAAIRATYEIVRDATKTNPGGPLTRAYNELKRRLTSYANAVEAARAAEAEKLRRAAEEKERLAREAEAREQDAIAGADVGECTDVGGAIAEAAAAYADYQRAGRAAAVAERGVPVRIGSIMDGKSLSMRTTRKLVVTDACAAIGAIGLTDGIRAEIVKAAKAFEDAYGELPSGVVETFERSM